LPRNDKRRAPNLEDHRRFDVTRRLTPHGSPLPAIWFDLADRRIDLALAAVRFRRPREIDRPNGR
jgi:hypothetical protein